MNSGSQQRATPDARVKTTGSPPPPGGGIYPVDGDIHLLDRIAVIYRYRGIAVSVLILTTLAVMI